MQGETRPEVTASLKNMRTGVLSQVKWKNPRESNPLPMPQRTIFADYSFFVSIDRLLAARDNAPKIIGRRFGANIKLRLSLLLSARKGKHRTNTVSALSSLSSAIRSIG